MARIPNKCPNCKSKNYRVVSKTKYREGFSVGKAVLGAALFGTPGTIIGGMSGKKKFIIKMRCKDCGYEEEYHV